MNFNEDIPKKYNSQPKLYKKTFVNPENYKDHQK